MPAAHADTMYKCVDARGKIAYSDLPCPRETKMAGEFAAPAPEKENDGAARRALQTARPGTRQGAAHGGRSARSPEQEAELQHRLKTESIVFDERDGWSEVRKPPPAPWSSTAPGAAAKK